MTEDKTKTTVNVAWAVTAIWFFVVIAISYKSWEASFFKGEYLVMNNIGDTIAGIISPVAAGWFILAVFLQRQELKDTREELSLNRAALEAQVEEMRETVRSQKKEGAKRKLDDLLILSGNDILAALAQLKHTVSNIDFNTENSWEILFDTHKLKFDGFEYSFAKSNLNFSKNPEIAEDQNYEMAMFIEECCVEVDTIISRMESEYGEEITENVIDEVELGELSRTLNIFRLDFPIT